MSREIVLCVFSSCKAGKTLAKGYLRPCNRGSRLMARPEWLVTRPRRETGARADVVGSVLVIDTRVSVESGESRKQ